MTTLIEGGLPVGGCGGGVGIPNIENYEWDFKLNSGKLYKKPN